MSIFSPYQKVKKIDMTFADLEEDDASEARRYAGATLRELARLSDGAEDPEVRSWAWRYLVGWLATLRGLLTLQDLPATLRADAELTLREFYDS
jgi:hypothetical protein